MGRPELGTKLSCTGCSERFYDLNRSPAVCPKCGAQQAAPKPRVYAKPGQSWRPRRPSAPIAADADERNAVAAPEAEDAEEAAEDETDTDTDADSEDAEADEPASLERDA
jgi:uncharacterized protein (TIGR02300 family)